MEMKEIEKVYAALLCSPGMNENVKIDLKLSRKTILLLNQVIERGMDDKTETGKYSMLDALGEDDLQGLRALAKDCLEKAGLTELSGKLTALNGK